MSALSAPLAVLAELVERFPDLPAPVVRIHPHMTDQVELSFHEDGLAPFEVWRSALRISFLAVKRRTRGSLMWLETFTDVHGVTISLVGFGTVAAPEPSGAVAS